MVPQTLSTQSGGNDERKRPRSTACDRVLDRAANDCLYDDLTNWPPIVRRREARNIQVAREESRGPCVRFLRCFSAASGDIRERWPKRQMMLTHGCSVGIYRPSSAAKTRSGSR